MCLLYYYATLFIQSLALAKHVGRELASIDHGCDLLTRALPTVRARLTSYICSLPSLTDLDQPPVDLCRDQRRALLLPARRREGPSYPARPPRQPLMQPRTTAHCQRPPLHISETPRRFTAFYAPDEEQHRRKEDEEPLLRAGPVADLVPTDPGPPPRCPSGARTRPRLLRSDLGLKAPARRPGRPRPDTHPPARIDQDRARSADPAQSGAVAPQDEGSLFDGAGAGLREGEGGETWQGGRRRGGVQQKLRAAAAAGDVRDPDGDGRERREEGRERRVLPDRGREGEVLWRREVPSGRVPIRREGDPSERDRAADGADFRPVAHGVRVGLDKGDGVVLGR